MPVGRPIAAPVAAPIRVLRTSAPPMLLYPSFCREPIAGFGLWFAAAVTWPRAFPIICEIVATVVHPPEVLSSFEARWWGACPTLTSPVYRLASGGRFKVGRGMASDGQG